MRNKAVQQLGLVRVNAGDYLDKNHLGLDAVFYVQVKLGKHNSAIFQHRRLAVRVHLEQAKLALQDLRAWPVRCSLRIPLTSSSASAAPARSAPPSGSSKPDGTVECSSGSAPVFSRTPLETLGNPGLFPSVSVGSDNLAIIAYRDNPSSQLKVAQCDDLACTAATFTTIDNGTYPSVIQGTDNLPLILYVGESGLKAAHCNNPAWTDVTISSLFINSGLPNLVLGADRLGLFSYITFPGNDLVIGNCLDSLCSSSTTTILDNVLTVLRTSLMIGGDGLGLVACHCSPIRRRPMT